MHTLATTVQSLQTQLEWFRRQMFGTKSERLRVLGSAQQLALGEVLDSAPETMVVCTIFTPRLVRLIPGAGRDRRETGNQLPSLR